MILPRIFSIFLDLLVDLGHPQTFERVHFTLCLNDLSREIGHGIMLASGAATRVPFGLHRRIIHILLDIIHPDERVRTGRTRFVILIDCEPRQTRARGSRSREL